VEPFLAIPIVTTIDAIELLEHRRRFARIRESKPGGANGLKPLERRASRSISGAELRALNGRQENRPHDKDRQDYS
jgi:hypothetical protein